MILDNNYSLIKKKCFLNHAGRRQPPITIEYHLRTEPRSYANDGYEAIPSSDTSSHQSESTLSQHSHESQTAMAFFKGNLGCIDLANPSNTDLNSVVVNDTNAEESREHSGEVISRSEPVVRERSCLVVENVYTEPPGERQSESISREESNIQETISCLIAINSHTDMVEIESSDTMDGPMFGHDDGSEENVSSQQVLHKLLVLSMIILSKCNILHAASHCGI